MHTSKFHDENRHEWVFLHNGDYSGDILINVPNKSMEVLDKTQRRVYIPFSVLKSLVAAYVRQENIAFYEQAEDDDVLSVKARPQ